MILTIERKKRLKKLWFTYGNNGPKHTKGNHRLIQLFLEEYKIGENVSARYKKHKKFFSKKPHHGNKKPLTDDCAKQIEMIFETI